MRKFLAFIDWLLDDPKMNWVVIVATVPGAFAVMVIAYDIGAYCLACG